MIFRRWMPLLPLLLASGVNAADLQMQGKVHLDYFVEHVDAEGYESLAADFDVEQIVNGESRTSAALQLAGWLTRGASAEGRGREVATLDIGRFAPGESAGVSGTAGADDAPPGEYVVHTLLQERSAPGTFVDSRQMMPTLLWRGGLEALGPLVVSDHGSEWFVSFDELRNNRIDARVSNPITLTLYATYGFGPASDGYTLCRATLPGLYAGDWRFDPGFSCWPDAPPTGEYTLHLMVAESGGRGGWSTLSGPDAYFASGRLESVAATAYGEGYYGGGLSASVLGPLWLAPLLFGRRRFLRLNQSC